MENLESLLKSYLQSNEKRLDRIESKIDNMSDTIVAIARVEEKLVSLQEARDRQGKRMGDVEARATLLETLVNSHEASIAGSKKLFWIIATSCITIYSGYLVKVYVL